MNHQQIDHRRGKYQMQNSASEGSGILSTLCLLCINISDARNLLSLARGLGTDQASKGCVVSKDCMMITKNFKNARADFGIQDKRRVWRILLFHKQTQQSSMIVFQF